MAGQGGGAEGQGEGTEGGILEMQYLNTAVLLENIKRASGFVYLLLPLVSIPAQSQGLLRHRLRERQAGTVESLA